MTKSPPNAENLSRTARAQPWLQASPCIVTLSDMLKFAASDWNEIVRILDSFELVQPKALNLITTGPKDAVLESLARVHKLCISLGLRAGAAQAQRVIADVEGKVFISEASKELRAKVEAGDIAGLAGTFSNVVDPSKLQTQIAELRSRIDDELESYELLLLEGEQRASLQDEEQFGPLVKHSFPESIWDIREAKRCLAFERYTACVYHLMRVLQLGVENLATRFDVKHEHRNWENILGDIQKAVENMDKIPKWNCLANWRDHREFYMRALGYLDVEKTGWRNPLMHARYRLDERDAQLAMDNVHAFMQQMSQPPPSQILKP